MHALRVAASCSGLEPPVKTLHLWMVMALSLGVAMPNNWFGTAAGGGAASRRPHSEVQVGRASTPPAI